VAVPPDVSGVVWNSKGDALVALAHGMNNASDLGPDAVAWLVKVDALAQPTRLEDSADRGGRNLQRRPARACTSWLRPRRMPPARLSRPVRAQSFRPYDEARAEDFPGTIAGVPILVGREIWLSANVGTQRTYMRLQADKLQPVPFDLPSISALDCDAKHRNCAWLGQSTSQPTSLYFAKSPGTAPSASTRRLLPNAWPAVEG
jgi:hypothetical protein